MRSAVLLVSLTSTLVLTAATGNAQAERPITTYEWVGPDMADIVEPQGHTSNIIFLNRCSGGCVINPGYNDSRTNNSSIVGRAVNIGEWGKGDAQWDDLVECVKAIYDPYDVVVTDVDPGADVEHFEAIVAGTAQDIGAGGGLGGVAPFSCGVINNAITFSFANMPFYANGVVGICETVAQETAHAFGLEHEYLCSDPMTYLPDCGKKYFQDTNSSCGEYEPSSCQCRNNQNSHRLLSDHFGPGENAGPKLDFVRPLPNSNISPDFVIEVSGDDYYFGVQNVEVLVNGESQGATSTPPYIFNAPQGLDGNVEIEVRGTDSRGIASSAKIEVNVGEGCSPGSCTDGRVCYKSFCVPGATSAGGFGATCENNEACESGLCGKDEAGVGSCTELCELNNGDCPEGFGCLKAGASNVCWPGVSEDTGGCGCNTGRPGSGLAGILLVLMGLMIQRRRRQ